jgi:glycerol-3-phosphate dehydrogenase
MTRFPMPVETGSQLEDGEWDLLVIGGGIAGATIFRDAARRGLRVILAERDDFAGGASSYSSKLIHGGLHYLARGQFGLARTLVHERDQLIETMPGLVEPVEVLLPLVEDDRLRRWGTEGGLCLYEAFAGRIGPTRSLSRAQLERRSPGLAPGASGALVYTEATVDDAGLVLRALAEGRCTGGLALNGLAAEGWLRDRRGRVAGAFLRDGERGAVIEVRARAIVNATGAEVEQFRGWRSWVDGVRLVRGSHLVLSHGRLPIDHAVATRHPDTGEALYVVPWQGAILVGSTNIACAAASPSGFRPSEAELTSLLRGVRWLFPGHELDWPDVVAVYTGLRTIAGRGRAPASRASRELVLWVEDGVWNVAGGKLSTAGPAAGMVLAAIAGPAPHRVAMADRVLDDHGLDPLTARRLSARYGAAGCAAIAAMPAAEQVEIPGHRTRWAELRWAARAETVRQLDDLLLRRVRLGLVERDGGARWLPAVRALVQAELGWDDVRWEREVDTYLGHRRRVHALDPAPPLALLAPPDPLLPPVADVRSA